jgi:membrane protein implicated in regulation of membrane protease activity
MHTVKAGFAIERRDRSDASVSFGKVRIRMPQWSFWILVLLVVGFFAMQIISIVCTGKPVPINGIIEASRRTGSLTNRVATVEKAVENHEGRIKTLEDKP